MYTGLYEKHKGRFDKVDKDKSGSVSLQEFIVPLQFRESLPLSSKAGPLVFNYC